VGHWTNSLYQYFEREQARLEGLPEPLKKSKIVETLAAARDRARKMSASVGGGTLRDAPPAANFHVVNSGGPGVASSMAVWGGGARRASSAAAPRRASHSVAMAAAAADSSSRRASHHSASVNNNNNNNSIATVRQMRRMDTSSQM
jgi:hypothetical protein